MTKEPSKPRLRAQSRSGSRARTTIQREAARRIKDARELARDAAKIAKRQETRELRSDLAKLKRKGLFKGNVRRAKPSKRLRDLISHFDDVLRGDARTFKVKTKAEQEHLVRQGVKVKNGRAVVSKSEHVRKGKVYRTGGTRTQQVHTLRRGIGLEAAVREAFRRLGNPPGGIAFTIYGNESYDVFHNPDALLYILQHKYAHVFARSEAALDHVRFFVPSESSEAYHARRRAEVETRAAEKQASRIADLSTRKARREARKYLRKFGIRYPDEQ